MAFHPESAEAFTALSDCPASYTGQGGKVARVNAGETGLEFFTVAGTGDVVGPVGSTDNAIVRWDGTSGDNVQNSIVTINDSGVIANASLDNTNAIAVKDNVFTVQDNVDPTKELQFQVSSVTTATRRTVTVPDADGTMTLLGNSATGTGDVVRATSPTLITPTLGVAAATSINKVAITQPVTGSTLDIADGLTLTYNATTFVPTVTLVGGIGNTVPQYTTNTGRFYRVGSLCFVDVLLDADGGNEGAGTGQLFIALPLTAHVSSPVGQVTLGNLMNAATYTSVMGIISGGATTVGLTALAGGTLISMTGNDQNNTLRTIRLSFFYEVA